MNRASSLLYPVDIQNKAETEYFDLHLYRYQDTLDLLEEDHILSKHILDLGTLPCHIPISLKQAGAKNVTGLDHAPNRFQSQKAIESHGITLKTCDIEFEKFPCLDSSIDTVIFTEVIEHFSKDPKHCLSEIKRVLKPGGTLLVTTPNIENLANRIRKIFGKSVYPTQPGLTGKQRHHHEYSMTELLHTIQNAGFTVMHTTYIAGSEKALIHGTFPTRIPKILGALYGSIPVFFPPFRSYLALRAQKPTS